MLRVMRSLNPLVRRGIANKQARYMGLFDEKDVDMVERLIENKGNDYYQPELFPDQGVVRAAEADYDSFRTGTEPMNVLASDMRRYYGLSEPKEVIAVKVPAASPETKAAVDKAVSDAKGGKGGVRKAMEALAVLDNKVQGHLRERILGLSDRDVDPTGYKALLGSTVFRPNRMAPDGPYKANTPGLAEDMATLLAARALQAGVVAGAAGATKAGVDEVLALLEKEEKDQDVSPGLMIRY